MLIFLILSATNSVPETAWVPLPTVEPCGTILFLKIYLCNVGNGWLSHFGGRGIPHTDFQDDHRFSPAHLAPFSRCDMLHSDKACVGKKHLEVGLSLIGSHI